MLKIAMSPYITQRKVKRERERGEKLTENEWYGSIDMGMRWLHLLHLVKPEI